MKEIKIRAPDDLIDRIREIAKLSGIPQSTILRNGARHEVNRLRSIFVTDQPKKTAPK